MLIECAECRAIKKRQCVPGIRMDSYMYDVQENAPYLRSLVDASL